MITYIDQNNAEQFETYKALFRKAEAELREAGRPEMTEGSITTLQEYFSVLEDLVKAKYLQDENGNYIDLTGKIVKEEEKVLDPKNRYYTILPLDEEPFKIDANTRTISIPKNFATNGVSVEGDQVAEILYFEIDRYFDAMDLNNQQIIIEWENASGDKKASCEWVRDIESKPGKIIFGWALDDSITKKAGNVKFAVRFYTIDEDKKRLYYSFGTQIAQVTIKPTLHYDLINKTVEIVNANELVLKRIKNSITGILPSPEAPYFEEALGDYLWVEGEKGWEKIALDAKGKLNIKVGSYLSTIADGSGNISYNWYFATKDPEAEDFDPAIDWSNVEDEVAPFAYTGSVCKVTRVGYYKVMAINTYEANELYQNSTESDYIVKIVGPTKPEVTLSASPSRFLTRDGKVILTANVNENNGVVTYEWRQAAGVTTVSMTPTDPDNPQVLEITYNNYIVPGSISCTVNNSFNGTSETKEANINVVLQNTPLDLDFPAKIKNDNQEWVYQIQKQEKGSPMTATSDEDGFRDIAYTWYKEDLVYELDEEDKLIDTFKEIDALVAETDTIIELDKIVDDQSVLDEFYANANPASGRNHRSTYTTSTPGYYFCKVEEIQEVDGVKYFGEPSYTGIYRILP